MRPWRVKNMCKGKRRGQRRSPIGADRLTAFSKVFSIAKNCNHPRSGYNRREAKNGKKKLETVLHIRLTLILSSLSAVETLADGELYVFTSSAFIFNFFFVSFRGEIISSFSSRLDAEEFRLLLVSLPKGTVHREFGFINCTSFSFYFCTRREAIELGTIKIHFSPPVATQKPC